MLEIKSENPGSLITHWYVWYWDGSAWQSDGQWHLIGSSVYVPNGTNTVGCYTRNVWGAESDFYMSQWFTPADNQVYIYNILNGTVTLDAEILFRNFRIESWTPYPATMEEGDTFRATCIVEYIGVYSGGKVYLAIGKHGITFDEILDNEVSTSFANKTSWTAKSIVVSIPITDAIEIGDNYDVYAKLVSVPGPDLFAYQDNIIDITGVPDAEFRNFEIHSYSPTTIRVGSTLRMVHRFEYQGPRYTSASIKAEIGNDIGGVMISDFEKVGPFTCGPDYSWQDYEIAVDIPITEQKPEGSKDIKATLNGVPGNDPSDKELNVVFFEGLGGAEFDTFRIVSFAPTQIAVGNTVKLNCSFRHKGKADPCRVYAAIGKIKLGVFDEYYVAQKNITTADDYDWKTYPVELNIYINEEVSDTVLDLYAKLDGIPGATQYDEREGVFTFAQMGEAEFQIIGIGSVNPTQVKVGDTVMMDCLFQHRGAAYTTGTIYASIGKVKLGVFDEYFHSETPFSVPADIEWKDYSVTVGVEFAGEVGDETLDIYVKLKNVPGTDPVFEQEDALTVIGGTQTDDVFKNLTVDFLKDKPAGVV